MTHQPVAPIASSPPANLPTPALRGRRWALAALVPLGPIAIAGVRLVLPYSDTDAPAAVATAVAAQPAAAGVVLWLDLLIAITLPVGVCAVAVLAIRAAPVLGMLGAALSLVGFGSLFVAVTPVDQLTDAAARAGLEPTVTARIIEAMVAHPAAAAGLILFLLGHVVGLILLGSALWVGRAMPRWAAAALIVSAPLHIVFVIALPSAPLTAGAWLLTAAGFGAAGIALARTSEDGLLTAP